MVRKDTVHACMSVRVCAGVHVNAISAECAWCCFAKQYVELALPASGIYPALSGGSLFV